MTWPTGQFEIVGTQLVIVCTEVVYTVEVVDSSTSELARDGDPEGKETGWVWLGLLGPDCVVPLVWGEMLLAPVLVRL